MFYRPYRLELDTPQDLQLIEKVYEILGEAPSLEEVVGLLSANPDISMLNAGISERTGPLSSYSAEQRAEWKFQQVQNTFQWMGDWSFLRNKTIPVNAQPVYCERNTCRIGFLKNGRLITLDGSEIVAGKIACSCGAGRSWHKERP